LRNHKAMNARMMRAKRESSDDISRKRILLIAYYFPPLGGPASIRLGKTVKYLRRAGWDIDVISIKNIIYHSLDYDLEKECQPGRIYRTNSLEVISLLYWFNRLRNLFRRKKRIDRQSTNKSGIYFSLPDSLRQFFKTVLIPDEKLGWFPFAFRQGRKLLRNRHYDLIMTSIGPATAGIVGYKLSRMSHIPLVIDYRDHWTLHPHTAFLTGFHRRRAESLERKILQHASLITTVGKIMKEELITRFCEAEEEKVSVIYNGYDEEDFTGLRTDSSREPLSPGNQVIFTYTGSLYPPITPLYLLKALKYLKKEGKLPEDLQVRFIGNYHRDMLNLLQDSELASHLTITPNLPHREIIREIMMSDVLLLLLSVKGGNGILTSKAFEYLRSGKPILAMIPQHSEIAEILQQDSKHYLCPMEDREKIAELLIKSYSDSKSIRTSSSPVEGYSNNSRFREFCRENQAKRLGSLLKTLKMDHYEKG